MVLHADAYGSIAFDPWIARGEDLDYLINARMARSDVWFDNQFSLLHLPPEGAQHSGRFEQDVYRWFYEVRKIEFAKTQIDLMQVAPSALDPYPGPWLEPSIHRRARLTAYLRAIGLRSMASTCASATRLFAMQASLPARTARTTSSSSINGPASCVPCGPTPPLPRSWEQAAAELFRKLHEPLPAITSE